LIKNSQPFGKKFHKTVGGGFFLTHTVDHVKYLCDFLQHSRNTGIHKNEKQNKKRYFLQVRKPCWQTWLSYL